RTAGQVVEQWDELKREERSEAGSVLAGVPATLPALARAQALQRRAVRAGFAWESSDQAWQKLEEELDELRQSETGEERLQEAGDVLFALTEVLRQWDVDAEEALRLGCRRFSQAFERMEERLASERRDFPDLSLNEKLSLWRESKGL
ncbi:MAG TPA: nucleoside triphosphate pyrophosphohydrolase, partial [Dehalococcoidia bacterium]|nr:nucleoside triphosphate pyrophosphohydrolase [Dehalococcoidia bacterium]